MHAFFGWDGVKASMAWEQSNGREVFACSSWQRKIVRACRFHVSTYGFISFCLMAALYCCNEMLYFISLWLKSTFSTWALGIFCFVNSYCWAYTKFDNRNNQFQTQDTITNTYKLQVSNLARALLVSTNVLMCYQQWDKVSSGFPGKWYVYNACCILLAFSGAENIRVKHVLHVRG